MSHSDNSSPQEIEALLQTMEQDIERLRVKYEQYFIGVERLPPGEFRQKVERNMRALEQMSLRRTEQKFRVRGLSQRLTSFRNYWNRVERQIEEGTYQRDVLKAKRRHSDEGTDAGIKDQKREEKPVPVFEVDLNAKTSPLDDIQRILQQEEARAARELAEQAARKKQEALERARQRYLSRNQNGEDS